MPTVIYNLPNGTSTSVDVPEGQSVMDGSVRNNLPGIVAECGGSCSCATCHVYLDESSSDAFGEPTPEETDLVEFLENVTPCSRLACQLVLTAGVDTVTVTVPDPAA
ncbi:2Fe-2S iron-sulfur cluster-binding protein [Rhodococcus sp. NPDC057297]|uniref:2Fe-2S iron-sulfur cluster-binding protein n=1 Tax=Rhodococcus sp. NPDC057297 TaxID=3346090 RepID=UPI00363809BB